MQITVEVPGVAILSLTTEWPPQWSLAEDAQDNAEAVDRVLAEVGRVSDEYVRDRPGGYRISDGYPGYQLAYLVAQAVGGRATPPPEVDPDAVY